MTWYKMNYTVDEYEKGQEYASLPDEIIEEFPDSFEVIEEEENSNSDPFK